ncbi:hypothetical protein CONLIGDRAFT_319095 [Coniochaeta ligniaria NRRL 30616]|uniref:Uncharacterized protein n=1 Tax=Coniochaeta ligniaria NRRL 30616 TaxID=1408157 RepID=A0A1J7I4D6_9PEZI|nr:hypothetical protein CONLIGDRAFT_319095 [Coniochaeta ligniaria NRRL 30616]
MPEYLSWTVEGQQRALSEARLDYKAQQGSLLPASPTDELPVEIPVVTSSLCKQQECRPSGADIRLALPRSPILSSRARPSAPSAAPSLGCLDSRPQPFRFSAVGGNTALTPPTSQRRQMSSVAGITEPVRVASMRPGARSSSVIQGRSVSRLPSCPAARQRTSSRATTGVETCPRQNTTSRASASPPRAARSPAF